MHYLYSYLTLLLALLSPALGAAVAPAPRTSAACSFVCPTSDRTSHSLVNTVRKGGMMECYYGQNGMCAYNLNAGKLKTNKSTSGDCRPNAIASCARKRTKTKNAKKKEAQAQAAALLIQRAKPIVIDIQDGSNWPDRKEHDDM